MKDKYRSRRSMTPQGFRDALADLGDLQGGEFSQRKCAEMLGLNDKTVRDWANPTMPGPPEPIARLLDFMIAEKITPAHFVAVLAKMETEE